MAKAVRRANRSLRNAEALAAGAERDEYLHEMRKAAKRLRYAAEAIRPMRGRPAKRLVRQVKAVQELLGEHQDSVVARGLLRELGASAPAGGGNGFAFGWLMRDEQARAERVEAQLDPTWKSCGGAHELSPADGRSRRPACHGMVWPPSRHRTATRAALIGVVTHRPGLVYLAALEVIVGAAATPLGAAAQVVAYNVIW